MKFEWPELDFEPWWVAIVEQRALIATEASPTAREAVNLITVKHRLNEALHKARAMGEPVEDLEDKLDETVQKIEHNRNLMHEAESQKEAEFVQSFASEKQQAASALWKELRARQLDETGAMSAGAYGAAAGLGFNLCHRLLVAQRSANEDLARRLTRAIRDHDQATRDQVEASTARRVEIAAWYAEETAKLRS